MQLPLGIYQIIGLERKVCFNCDLCRRTQLCLSLSYYVHKDLVPIPLKC